MIIPGILEGTFSEISMRVYQISKVAKIIQVDFADGILVEGSTFLDTTKLDSLGVKAQIEMHLMVTDPELYVETKVKNVDKVCAQIEASEHINAFIKKARERGYKVGLSVAPETPLTKLEQYITQIDYVQFMTVVPGKQGNPFRTDVLQNIAYFKQLHPSIELQVDGGVGPDNISVLKSTGVDNMVVGSKIFDEPDPVQAYLYLESLFNSA